MPTNTKPFFAMHLSLSLSSPLSLSLSPLSLVTYALWFEGQCFKAYSEKETQSRV
jgi:hypothetical protein